MGLLPSSTTDGLTRWVEEDRLVPVGTKPQGRSGTHRSPGVIIPSRVTVDYVRIQIIGVERKKPVTHLL